MVAAAAEPEPEPEPVAVPEIHEPVHQEAPEPFHASAPEIHQPAPEPEPEPVASALQEFVTDLESSLGDGFLPGTVAKPVEPVVAPAASVEPAVAAAQPAPVLGEFVADIEASLGEDFLKAAPVPEAPHAVASAAVPAPVAPPRISPLAASAAASASPTSHVVTPTSHVTAPASRSSAAPVPPPAPSLVDIPKPQAPAIAPPHAPAAAQGSPFAEEAGVDLAEMFGELKHELESEVAAADEDPETHYNLGVAFREMGLLDEAIGELQKACQSFDRGHPFPQIMQTYTWLAQCFLEKGVPEAAIRWYDKALNRSRHRWRNSHALHYELASAYEAAGDKTSAFKHSWKFTATTSTIATSPSALRP